MKRFFVFLILISLLIIPININSSASCTFVPYNTYEYNSFDESVEAPTGYVPNETIDSAKLGLEVSFSEITDMVFKNGVLYVLDSGNGRIVSLDENYNVLNIYSDFKIGNENHEELYEKLLSESVSIKGANGIAVSDEGKFYIADTLNNRILCINKNCFVESAIFRPDKALQNTEASFSPVKVEVDDENKIYVATKSISMGIMIFENDGSFVQFFGANQAVSKTQAFVKSIRKIFMTAEQASQVEQAIPVTIRNMDFSEDGFMYTVSPYKNESSKSAEAGMLRKLNYMGENLLSSALIFGDLEEDEEKKTWFSDVEIDSEGFINLLDEGRCRVFQYTDNGMLLSVFGSNGDQTGCFSQPSAIETVNDKVLVADKAKNCIFVYTPTDYAKTIRSAVLKMNNNDLQGSIDEWNNLHSLNSNSYFAYKGLGMVYDYKGDYSTAMKYFKLAYDQDNYALAYQQRREKFIEDYSLLILAVAVAFVVAVAFALRKLKKLSIATGSSAYSVMEQKYTMPFYVLIHPIDGCSQFKRRKIASLGFSIFIILFWLCIRILDFNLTGFAFKINRSTDFNMSVQLLLTIGIFVIFVASNWFISILLEGKGNTRDIIAVTAYSLIPYLATQGLKILLTNVLVPSENVFIGIITTLGLLWTAAILFIGLMTIHEYSVGKNILSLLLTAVIMIFIVFLALLLYGLLQQVVNFVLSVYKELSFRL